VIDDIAEIDDVFGNIGVALADVVHGL